MREDEADLIQSLSGRRALIARNKSDLNSEDSGLVSVSEEKGPADGLSSVFTSALTGQGIGELRNTLLDMVRSPGSETESGMLTNLRHHEAVTAALASLSAAKTAVGARIPHEMLSSISTRCCGNWTASPAKPQPTTSLTASSPPSASENKARVTGDEPARCRRLKIVCLPANRPSRQLLHTPVACSRRARMLSRCPPIARTGPDSLRRCRSLRSSHAHRHMARNQGPRHRA